jgi:hypothetical protein
MPNTDRFHYENPSDPDNEISVYIEDDARWEKEHIGWLVVSVSDEKAVDSYNSMFACDIHVPPNVAAALRDYLNRKFPA